MSKITKTPTVRKEKCSKRSRTFKECRGSWSSNHFQKLPTGERRCLAEGCRKIYGKLSGHHALRRHWSRKHNQTTADKYNFCDFKHDNHLIKWIIDSQASYSEIDRPSFRRYVGYLNPSMKIMCCKTLSKTIDDKLGDLKIKIKTALEKEPSLALTFDVWSPSRCTTQYGCITANFIDEKWIMRSLILELKLLPYPYTGDDILELVKSVIDGMKIRTKIISITSNDDPSVVESIEVLERDLNLGQNFGMNKLTHIRCLGHIINLAVQTTLKNLKPYLIEARKFVSSITSSSERSDIFREIQQRLIEIGDPDLNIEEPLELVDDDKGPWTSTYLMIHRLTRLKKPIQEAQLSIPDLKELQTIDWQRIEALEQFLMPLYCLNNKLSGERSCTISLVSSAIPKVIEYLEEPFFDFAIQEAAFDLKRKLLEFIAHIQQDTVFVANILDPRFKTIGLQANSINTGSALIREMCQINTTSANRAIPAPQLKIEDDLNDIFFVESDATVDPLDELQSYLAAPRDHPKTDLMASWEVKAKVYPGLASVARKFLPIQATSIASERLLPIAGDSLTEKVRLLQPDNFRSNILCKSWLEFIDGDF